VIGSGFGKYEVYTVTGSIYCYPQTNVLKNRFGIRDNQTLKELEADFSVLRQNELLNAPIKGHFTPNHLCRIHRYLFGDLYTFAGHYRREDIMKGHTRFLNHTQIADKLSSLLHKLKEEQYLSGLDFGTFAERSAFYFAELNYIHPFREGNGRSCREFMRMLYERNGYEVVWDTVPRETLLQIMEESVYDSTSLSNLTKEYLKQK
jgi:cell filamentation protein